VAAVGVHRRHPRGGFHRHPRRPPRRRPGGRGHRPVLGHRPALGWARRPPGHRGGGRPPRAALAPRPGGGAAAGGCPSAALRCPDRGRHRSGGRPPGLPAPPGQLCGLDRRRGHGGHPCRDLLARSGHAGGRSAARAVDRQRAGHGGPRLVGGRRRRARHHLPGHLPRPGRPVAAPLPHHRGHRPGRPPRPGHARPGCGGRQLAGGGRAAGHPGGPDPLRSHPPGPAHRGRPPSPAGPGAAPPTPVAPHAPVGAGRVAGRRHPGCHRGSRAGPGHRRTPAAGRCGGGAGTASCASPACA
jgi:hypothetical protein